MPQQLPGIWRYLIAVSAGMVLASMATAAESGGTRWTDEARRRQEAMHDLVWFDHEPLAVLLRRGTGLTDHVAEDYERQHTRENISRLAAAGVTNAGNLHFYKGFGLAAEHDEIERTKAAAALAHERGMRVSLYVGGTMFVETFFQETPAAKDWEQRDGDNRPIPYIPTQAFRHYASVHEPAYREYLKKVLRVAVQEVHADEIFFDNTMLQPEPESDHGPQAVRAFHEFLKRRYPNAAAANKRFGISDTDWLRAPEWSTPSTPEALTEVTEPVLQEWIRFRAESLAAYCAELYDYIKQLDPHVAVGFNIKGVFPFNRIWTNAVYHPLFAGHCDYLTFDSGGINARIDPATGAVITQIRSYKMARELRMSCVDDKLGDELSTAMYMAFNYHQTVGGNPLGGPEAIYASNILTPAFEFFRHYNDRYYTDTAGVADIGVLYTWPSLAYSINVNYLPLDLAEQVLIQYKIPFAPVADENLAQLERFRAILVAGQDAMSEKTVARLLEYVRAGGVLLVTPGTAVYDDWRRHRSNPPFATARMEGKGKIVLLPAIIPAGTARRVASADDSPEINRQARAETRRFGPTDWMLPRNHVELGRVIAGSLGDEPSLTTGAPLTSVIEMLERSASRETIIHFVHCAPVTQAFPVTARGGAGKITGVQFFTPDRDEPEKLVFTEEHGRVRFTVPASRVYGMVVIAHE
jgi:hypothetical protein